MAKDDVSICNIALGRIGVTKKIASLSPPDRTLEAIELANVYEEVRDRVLSAIRWPFARMTAALQKTGDTPYKWLYRYEYPNDCLDIRAIYPPQEAGSFAQSIRLEAATNPVRYELGLDENDALTICTDQDLAVIEYTARVTNPRQFNASFASALAWAIASEVALPLAKTIEHSEKAAKMYEKEIREAAAKALNEEKREDPPDSEFVIARI